MAPALHEAAAREFQTQREFLRGFCRRMTGSAADADALVQETFVRVLELPPTDGARRQRLARVAASHSIEALRLRQHRAYVGPWLPAPVDTGDAASPPTFCCGDVAPCYDDVESLTVSFLLALEHGAPTRYAFLMLNGLPALRADVPARAGWAQRYVFRINLDLAGRITELQTILATRKLPAVRLDPT